ncbi:DNA/RNA non-specific endonuclease [Massilia forsythiae]|uniref:Endonuclease n=1 Tax=Massilia forsythiae TaxID=2728020 RepID=A0A7Z2VZI0_9BURK|nr:DNA/RNA non-specific endonuclease [Massilia forsythiae]QJE02282.1 DNA/RNA non-specific endonuclease [Massilia forsythiae]
MFQKFFTGAILATGLLAGAGAQAQLFERLKSAVQAHVQAQAPAQDRSCAGHYMGGREPQIVNPKLAASTRELCFNVFGVMHSGVTRTPLWSAEHLRADNVAAAQDLSRENSFHAETRLPAGQRAELADYARSGYDRGHMAPNGDMPDRPSQRDSFSLANIVPQNGENNRNQWAAIEGAVRAMAKREGDLYVITGPAFLGANLSKIGQVLVPTHLYKVVYSPRQKAGAAWFVENRADAKPTVIPITELERIVGINFLPALGERDKERMLSLPKIRANGGRG